VLHDSIVLKKVLKIFLVRGKGSKVEKKLAHFTLKQKKIRFLFLFMLLESIKKLKINVKLKKVKKGKFTEKAPEYLAKKQVWMYTRQFFKTNITLSIEELQDWVLNVSRVRRQRLNYFKLLLEKRLNKVKRAKRTKRKKKRRKRVLKNKFSIFVYKKIPVLKKKKYRKFMYTGRVRAYLYIEKKKQVITK